MGRELQAAVAAGVPGAAALGLVLPPSVDVVLASVLADPAWTAEALRRRSRAAGSGDLRVLATVWWYSVSTVLLTPPLAGLLAGRPLSGRLDDLSIALLPGVQPIAAESGAASDDPVPGLRESLGAVVAAVAAAGRMRERPLWAIATDSLANVALSLGRPLGDVPTATRVAVEVACGIGAPLLVPRYVGVAGARFARRASCCLMVELPGGQLCTSCPRRPPAERAALLECAARWV
jgi:ferric iron reductase protein FhuF